jgi:hypothetical protein
MIKAASDGRFFVRVSGQLLVFGFWSLAFDAWRLCSIQRKLTQAND